MILCCLDGTDILTLSRGSSRKVLIKCDDCDSEYITDYRNIIGTGGRWCKKCCHKHKRIKAHTEEQIEILSNQAVDRFTGRKFSEETKRKIGLANKKSIDYYIDLFKINDRVKYKDCKWLYKCNNCDIEFELSNYQFSEVVRHSKKNLVKNNFCSTVCRCSYIKKFHSYSLFQKGQNSGGTSWNKGIDTSAEVKKKIADGFNKNLDQHRYNMRLSAIKRISKLKQEGKILTYPNRSIGEIDCYNKIKQMLPQYHVLENKEIFGYFVDIYIEELNVAIEFDERHHFKYNTSGVLILSDRDIKRQKEIQNCISCDFFRITEMDWKSREEEIKIELLNKLKSYDTVKNN